jgi:hypothetical protein
VALTKQVWVDGSPTVQKMPHNSGTSMKIWRVDGHNCAIGSYGITTTRTIKKGKELLMNYGDNWAYKLTIVRTVARLMADVASALGI